MRAAYVVVALASLLAPAAHAWRSGAVKVNARSAPRAVGRRVLGGASLAGAAALLRVRSASALEAKRRNVSPKELAEIVTADVVERQFLATADFTRSLYDESATFTDEIDSYTLDKFITGTSKLFVKDKSNVRLSSPVTADEKRVEFSFEETLCFNLPFVKPLVSLSGRVVLERDPESGLFTSYREYWDQKPADVIRSATF